MFYILYKQKEHPDQIFIPLHFRELLCWRNQRSSNPNQYVKSIDKMLKTPGSFIKMCPLSKYSLFKTKYSTPHKSYTHCSSILQNVLQSRWVCSILSILFRSVPIRSVLFCFIYFLYILCIKFYSTSRGELSVVS